MNLKFLLLKAIPPGARWITVRPNGPGTEGQPVLIQPSSDGAFRVIGGAGGKLNYLKLTGVRSSDDYKGFLQQHRAARLEARKRQQKQDREMGLTAAKKQATDALHDQLHTEQQKFVETVGHALGWTPEEMRFPEENFRNISPAARKAAERKHGNDLLRRAQEAVDFQREQILQAADKHTAEALGEIPLTSASPEQISVQDLDPIEPSGKGLGFSPEYGKRAEERGVKPEEIAEEAAAAKPQKAEHKDTGSKIADELATVRDPGPKVDPHQIVDTKKAVDLLKAQKQLRAVQRQARDKLGQIATAKEKPEPKAFVLDVGAPVDQDVVKDLENDLRTVRTRAFLDGVGKIAGGTESLGKYIGAGAYNSVNALALAAGGAALLDRSVVDVLGVAGAAQVLARRLSTDLTEGELENTRQAMEAFHVDHYMAASEAALKHARECQELAQQIELGEATTGADLARAQEMNGRRRDLVAEAQRTLGTALGEMEANAALVAALGQPKKGKLEASLGGTPIEEAIRQARAIGLDRGDYEVERIGPTTVLTVTGAGMDKLARPVDREAMERTRRSLDIIEGRQDEDDWLPNGVARRPDLAMPPAAPGVAPRVAEPFHVEGGDVAGAIKAYIGGRAADGDSAPDIISGLLSEDTLQAAGDRRAFLDALNGIAPLYDEKGNMIRAEAHAARFEKLADAFVAARGGERTAIHRQQVPVDHTSVDALHRALAEHPDGVAAFKPVGDLTPQDQAAIRGAFAREFGRVDLKAAELQDRLAKLDASAPERESVGMFGPQTNPEWTSWKKERDDAAAAASAATMTWGKYVEAQGSPERAYAAMQDVLRGEVLDSFSGHYNRLRPNAPLKLGRTAIVGDLAHLDALDPEAREKRLAERRDLVDRLRNRAQGRYAAGGVSEKIDAARAAEEAWGQAQMGLFGAEEAPANAEPKEKPLGLGERRTIGHAAERTVASMMNVVGPQFRPGQPVKLWQPNMSGKYVRRQRAVKLISANRRVMLAMGTGSGKTSVMLSGFTQLHGAGKAKRGLFIVPSVVQGQFHGEALTLLEPGKFKWHCNPGASRAERIAAYKDPSIDFNVVTHQAFRDDMLHLAAVREKTTPEKIAKKIDGMKPEERAGYMRDLLDAEGIDHDYLAVDEGHNLLNRQGKQNSTMANVIDAISADQRMAYVSATADPVKNDTSEAFDVLSKMQPDRYHDRAAFMRKYGVDTAAAREGLRREMASCFYTAKIDPGVAANRRQVKVTLNEKERGSLAKISRAAAAARLARMEGKVDVEALRVLSPGSFEGVDPARHEAVAKKLQRSVGILKDSAVSRILNDGSKTESLIREAVARRGKPGVVFAHNLDAVKQISARLKQEGFRAATLTGADGSAEKDRIKRDFQAGKADILVASDAAAVGANLQHGKWLAQVDTPDTAMLHAQREARINRFGQTEDVDLIDLVADHPAERRARKRLADKYQLRDIMTSSLEGLDDTGLALYLQKARSGDLDAGRPSFMPAGMQEAQASSEGEPQAQLF